MTRIAKFGRRMAVAGAAASMAALAVVPGTSAADAPLILPAGTACSFGLRIDIVGPKSRVDRVFTDANGNKVREISAGRGAQLTFTNLATGATLALRSNGAVTRTVVNPDGTRTVTDTGHNVLILFPTDVPAGPSTTLFVGRIVFTADANDNFTLRSTSGTATNICAALS